MINLKIAQLRKKNGYTQQELGELLGVSYQTVSKWETGVTLPDITVLPALSRCFQVTTDELLGLVPLEDEYCPSEAGRQEYWMRRVEYLKTTRENMWNTDYMSFLIERVWGLKEPVKMLDCGCGCGFLGMLLLPLLPAGSTYTGIDFTQEMLEEGRRIFESEGLEAQFIPGDITDLPRMAGTYDLVVSQAVLRHVDRGDLLLGKMIEFAKTGGLVVSMECNREFEAAGLYIEGMDYTYLSGHDGLRKLWKTEYEMQRRDHAIAMKIPHYMRKAGLKDIGVRMNDRITYLAPGQNEYESRMYGLVKANHWERKRDSEQKEEIVRYFMNHGMNREEAEQYCEQQDSIADYLAEQQGEASLTQFTGIIVSYGWK